jgi:hypothetical protein
MKLGMFPVRQPDAVPSKNRPQQFAETVTETRHVGVDKMVGRTGRSHEEARISRCFGDRAWRVSDIASGFVRPGIVRRRNIDDGLEGKAWT